MRYLFFAFGLWLTNVAFVYGQNSQLIVFTDTTSSSLPLLDFNQHYLGHVSALAKEIKLELKVIDASSGLPKEVTALPAIYFIHQGQKYLYKGRYHAVDRLRTFIQNQKVFGFKTKKLIKEDVWVRLFDMHPIGIVVKPSGLRFEGNEEIDLNFNQEIKNTLRKSFASFQHHNTYGFVPQSKLYYLNIHPYKATSGDYYISYEVYSQHNCKIPVFKNFKNPIAGKYKTALAELVQQVDQLMPVLMKDTLYKDGLYTSTDFPIKTWEEIGVNILSQTAETDLPEDEPSFLESGRYTILIDSTHPPISFTFQPPVSQYTGTFSTFNGDFSYEEGVCQGEFVIKTNSLNMGDDYLNESVLDEQLLLKSFPEIKLTFKETIKDWPLYETKPLNASLYLLGVEQDVIIETEFRPADENNTWFVLAHFTLNITPFTSLEKPDGPSPENENIQIFAGFKLQKN